MTSTSELGINESAKGMDGIALEGIGIFGADVKKIYARFRGTFDTSKGNPSKKASGAFMSGIRELIPPTFFCRLLFIQPDEKPAYRRR